MPLILMCGIPCSGKSRRAEELRSCLSDKYGIQSFVVGEELCCTTGEEFQRNITFNNEAKEKELRAHLRSEVQRTLGKDKHAVIVDSPNYIKGYRYELFCLSKANQSTYCVVHCDTNPEMAWNWNQQEIEGRPVHLSYTRATFDALIARFESPDSRNRWDAPLFTLQPEDQLPIELIHKSLFLKKPPPANQSTQSQPLLDTNFLYNLDKVTQDIVYGILEAQKTASLGDEIVLPNSSTKFRLTRKFTPSELARLRRQFVVYIKMHPVEDCNKCSNMFATYLGNGNLE